MKKDRFETCLDRLAKAIEKTKNPKLELRFAEFLNELKPLLQEHLAFCTVLSLVPETPPSENSIVNVKVKGSA